VVGPPRTVEGIVERFREWGLSTKGEKGYDMSSMANLVPSPCLFRNMTFESSLEAGLFARLSLARYDVA
jgi:hypothetical protein